jgi:pyruvate,water dikinase
VLEAARRLTERKQVGAVEDAFLLTYDELQEALRTAKGELFDLVEERRREEERNRATKPPAAVGAPPPEQVAENQMMLKFFGGLPEESNDPRVFKGNAASAGKVTGTARVVMSLEESEKLNNGEILVCPATMPPWTPLFGIASAVVTDHGGVLSHTAIVAREYGIPAVVGTKVGTSLVRDGQTISVDGDAGTVTLEAD